MTLINFFVIITSILNDLLAKMSNALRLY